MQCKRWCRLVLVIGCFAGLVEAETLQPRFYGFLDLRHHLNTYFDHHDFQEHQDPSVHLRTQGGVRLYGGIVDLYGTTGVVKRPQTQQILQRRPEIEVDYFPVRGALQVLGYMVIYPPFSGEEVEIQRDDEENIDMNSLKNAIDRTPDGTVVTLGLRPSYRYSGVLGSGVLTGRWRLDMHTRLYSRKQYVEVRDLEEQDHQVEVVDPVLFAKPGLNLEWVPTSAPSWFFQASAALHWDSQPTYQWGLGRAKAKYKIRRSSHWRLRVRHDIGERLTLINDFYTFHEGFFAEDRMGDRKRHRNILRLICKL